MVKKEDVWVEVPYVNHVCQEHEYGVSREIFEEVEDHLHGFSFNLFSKFYKCILLSN